MSENDLSSKKNHNKEEKNHKPQAAAPENKAGEAQNSAMPAETAGNKEDYENLKNRYLRLAADFENARKRWEREREEIIRFAESSLLRDILVILDELEQALKMAGEHADTEKITRGLEMTGNNFRNILKKRGVTAIEAKGKKFDPHFHEIAASVEAEEKDEHIVTDEIQKGYLLEDKVLRTAKVIVGVTRKMPEKKEAVQAETNGNEGLGEA